MKSASQRHENSAEYARIYLSCIQQFDEACRSVFKGHRFHRLCEEKKVLGRKKKRFPIFKATERNVASRIVLNPSGYRASGPPSSSGLYLNLQSDVSPHPLQPVFRAPKRDTFPSVTKAKVVPIPEPTHSLGSLSLSVVFLESSGFLRVVRLGQDGEEERNRCAVQRSPHWKTTKHHFLLTSAIEIATIPAKLGFTRPSPLPTR